MPITDLEKGIILRRAIEIMLACIYSGMPNNNHTITSLKLCARVMEIMKEAHRTGLMPKIEDFDKELEFILRDSE